MERANSTDVRKDLFGQIHITVYQRQLGLQSGTQKGMILNNRLLSATTMTALARKPGKAMDLTDYVLSSSFFSWTVE